VSSCSSTRVWRGCRRDMDFFCLLETERTERERGGRGRAGSDTGPKSKMSSRSKSAGRPRADKDLERELGCRCGCSQRLPWLRLMEAENHHLPFTRPLLQLEVTRPVRLQLLRLQPRR
jgi:hypothetical protein